MIWDLHTLLMVDPHLVDRQVNASLIRETAFKHDANPLVTVADERLSLGGKATDIQFRLIHKVGGVYRLWYSLWGLGKPGQKIVGAGHYTHYAYAQSTDGIHFKPVILNQVKYAGSKRNNLIDFSTPDVPDSSISHFMVDPLDDEFPYKCVYYRPATAGQLEPGIRARMQEPADKIYRFVWGIGKSRDGLHWLAPENKDNLINAGLETARLHRGIQGEYVLSDQMMSSVEGSSGRAVKGWISTDGITSHRVPGWVFDVPQHMGRIYPEFAGVHLNNTRWVQPHVGLNCARKGPTIIGLNGYLYYGGYVETFAQVADVGLCVSPSGVAFREVWPMRPFIPMGQRGSWDAGMVAQGGIIDDGEQTRFYYTGNNVGNFDGQYAIGMAYIPRDRYGYQMIRGYRDNQPKPRMGQIFLKPVTLPSLAKLSVNVSHLARGGSVRLELTDENSQPLKGFQFKDCKPVTREGLRKPIIWNTGKDPAMLAGKKIRIGIQLDHPHCGSVQMDSPRIYAIHLK